MRTDSTFDHLNPFSTSKTMPALFVGHGNPMLAISENHYTRTWQALGERLPKPKAILSVSAHWTRPGSVQVTAMENPKTIHDFGGFPQALYEQRYPAPGAPEWAKAVCETVQMTQITPNQDWGLDHGTWTVLKYVFPKADIPVFQLSLDISQPPQFHFNLGKALSPLREKGVLILGSGNVTHNLAKMSLGGSTPDWASAFDQNLKNKIDARDYDGIVALKNQNPFYQINHPSDEHFLPILYVLAQNQGHQHLTYFNDDFDLGSISMRSFLIA